MYSRVFESKQAFDVDAFAKVNQSSYELLSLLLARTDDTSSALVKQVLCNVVGQTVRTGDRSNGSALVIGLHNVCF